MGKLKEMTNHLLRRPLVFMLVRLSEDCILLYSFSDDKPVARCPCLGNNDNSWWRSYLCWPWQMTFIQVQYWGGIYLTVKQIFVLEENLMVKQIFVLQKRYITQGNKSSLTSIIVGSVSQLSLNKIRGGLHLKVLVVLSRTILVSESGSLSMQFWSSHSPGDVCVCVCVAMDKRRERERERDREWRWGDRGVS